MTDRDPNLKLYEKRVFIGFFVLFGTFFIHSMIIGGDAINGHIIDGVHYVSAAGRDTEVSAATWYLLATLGRTSIVCFLLMFVYSGVKALTQSGSD